MLQGALSIQSGRIRGFEAGELRIEASVQTSGSAHQRQEAAPRFCLSFQGLGLWLYWGLAARFSEKRRHRRTTIQVQLLTSQAFALQGTLNIVTNIIA